MVIAVVVIGWVIVSTDANVVGLMGTWFVLLAGVPFVVGLGRNGTVSVGRALASSRGKRAGRRRRRSR